MTITDDSASIALLEQQAEHLRERLHPETADNKVSAVLDTAIAKFRMDYGADPPASMLDQIRSTARGEYDRALAADLESLSVAREAVQASLDADIATAEALPSPLEDAYAARPTMTHSERLLTELLSEQRQSKAEARLAGATFRDVDAWHKTAVAQEDRVSLRVLEAAAAAGWPMVNRDPVHLDSQQALEQRIKATRAARVPESLRESRERLQKLWSASLDSQARALKRGFKVAGR